ncbi:phenylalanine ammonia-lyase [Puccinia sorghi]|uniref:Phenylalanine ammonia-lyase n=1 Tax=Puccinia sorghi TaxID=27349 RepID=A0A0L6UR85_9BASI|nr:phenylalanine ammonia-lyase [Puccinia sorghi]
MLQYLSGPVKNNFESVKGHSQAINSLDFISSTKILEAIEILKIYL